MNTRYYDSFLGALLRMRTKRELRVFLNGLLTEKEREELPVRLQIVKMIKRNIPHHEIASQLGVGIATVTRGSKEISKGNFSNWR